MFVVVVATCLGGLQLEGVKENRISNKQVNNVCKFMHTPCCHVHEDNNDGVVEFFVCRIFFHFHSSCLLNV